MNTTSVLEWLTIVFITITLCCVIGVVLYHVAKLFCLCHG